VLRDELDVEPAPETRELYQQIRKREIPELPRAVPNNLPIPLTRFIGREKELDSAQKRLLNDEVRLLTLTGPGGIGKTRLGLQVAADLLDHFEDGAYFVDLAPLSDPGLVVSTIAQTLGVREAEDQPLFDLLKESLWNRQMLLLLDNFERVVAAAPQVVELLEACPQLKLLVTSREALHVRGEHEFSVPPLGLPEPDDRRSLAIERLTQYEAVRLFIERVVAVKPDFEVTRENGPTIAEICARLDGLPLAIELAAARIKLLSPQALLERLGSRLKLLTGGARDLPARQRTLRDTIDWSYDLLDASEKILFERLSVFVGGGTLEAAEVVCSEANGLDVLDGLASLVDKSLLHQQEEQAEGEPRFLMLETIREYGLECLEASGEAEATRRTHADYYLALAEAVEPELEGPEQGKWLDRLEAEHDNLRAALEWFKQSGEAEAELWLAGAMWGFWYVRGYVSEGRRWLEGALKRGSGASALVRAQALNNAGGLVWRQGDLGRAAELFEESLTLYQELGDKWGIADSLSNLGVIVRQQGDLEQAVELFEESLALDQELGNKQGIAISLLSLGNVVVEQGNYERAAELFEEGLALSRELGDKRDIAASLTNLGGVAVEQGDLGWAAELFEESLALDQELGDKEGIASSLSGLGEVARHQGDLGQAVELFEESLTLYRELGDKRGSTECLEGLAGLTCARGQPERAARLFGAAEALCEAIGAPLSPADRADYDRDVSTVHAGLDEEAFAAAWAEGRAMTLEQAIAYALRKTDNG
ncbi:MAG: tetratricopeptide repeat protein, partial [Dehalococcoidia bacterium]